MYKTIKNTLTYSLCLGILSVPFLAKSASLDDLLNKQPVDNTKTSNVISKKDYFNRIQGEIFKWMLKPRQNESLKYMDQDVERLPVKYSDSNEKEKLNELNSILKNEYHMNGDFRCAEKGNFDFRRFNTALHYLSQYYGIKFVKEYLTEVGYEDKGLEKFSERQRKEISTYGRLDRGIAGNLKRFKDEMAFYKNKPETEPIKNFISDYNEFLVETYKIAMVKLFKSQEQYAESRSKVREEYQILLKQKYTGAKPKKACMDLIISGLQQMSFPTEFSQEACKLLDSYYYYRGRCKCDIKNGLEFIVNYPITATEMVVPLANHTLDEIIDSVEPVRKSAEAALSICGFSGN